MTPSSTGKSKKSGKKRAPKKSAASAKTGAKKKSRPKKSKARSPKKGAFWSRFKFNLIYMTAGLLAGIVGAFFLFYYSGDFLPQKQDRQAQYKTASRDVKEDHPLRSGDITFEENNHLDRQIKKIDQALYQALTKSGIPEKDIRFVKLTRKKDNGREWHHAFIEVKPPAGFKVKKLTKELKAIVGKLPVHPRPRLIINQKDGATQISVLFNGLETHDLSVMLPEKAAELKPVIAKNGKPLPKVAIIIDDMGQDISAAQCFLQFEGPLAFSILPFLDHTKKVADLVGSSGRVVMLHMPMEPAHWPEVDPGRGAVYVNMDREQIMTNFREAILAVPEAKGVNNHMGSRFSEDPVRMAWIMEEIGAQGLYFVDSRTSARTQGYKQAKKLGVLSAERSVFLDNIQEAEAITIQLRRLVAHARQNGQAIAIGHPYRVTCNVLKQQYNYLNANVQLVKITDLLQ